MFQRQERKLPVAREWVEALGLRPGQTVADFGCGPGRFSLLLADAVAPGGKVIAVDRSAEALQYLREQPGTDQIHTVQADAREADLGGERIDAALVTDMLHHTEGQDDILRRVHGLLAPGAVAVVAEFDPAAPGEHGPPLHVRVSPDQVRGWLEGAGFRVERFWPQAMEHYAFQVRKP